MQGTFVILKGTCVVIHGTSVIIQGTSVIIQGTFDSNCLTRMQAVDNKLLDRAMDILDISLSDRNDTFLCIVTDDIDMLPALQKVSLLQQIIPQNK
jgi:hypothetical protein